MDLTISKNFTRKNFWIIESCWSLLLQTRVLPLQTKAWWVRAALDKFFIISVSSQKKEKDFSCFANFRPVLNESEPLNLTFGITLQQIIDVVAHLFLNQLDQLEKSFLKASSDLDLTLCLLFLPLRAKNCGKLDYLEITRTSLKKRKSNEPLLFLPFPPSLTLSNLILTFPHEILSECFIIIIFVVSNQNTQKLVR